MLTGPMGYLFCLIHFAFLHLPGEMREERNVDKSVTYLGDSSDILRLRSERTLSRTAVACETEAVEWIGRRTRGRQTVSCVEVITNGECPRESHRQTDVEGS